MHTDKHYVDYAREIRDMRARYTRGLLKIGWNIVLGSLGRRGRHGADDHSLSGNGVIDTQHQRLSDYANNLRATILSGRPVDEANAIIDAFIRDLVQHFQDEEAILAASNYPGTAKHATLHRELLNRAATLIGQFRAGASSIGELFRFLAHDVLAKHMVGADREFIPYLENQHYGLPVTPRRANGLRADEVIV